MNFKCLFRHKYSFNGLIFSFPDETWIVRFCENCGKTKRFSYKKYLKEICDGIQINDNSSSIDMESGKIVKFNGEKK